MKLKAYDISFDELQDYLDKYEEKIKFIVYYQDFVSGSNNGRRFLVIIDEA